jgi:hypothetical protein
MGNCFLSIIVFIFIFSLRLFMSPALHIMTFWYCFLLSCLVQHARHAMSTPLQSLERAQNTKPPQPALDVRSTRFQERFHRHGLGSSYDRHCLEISKSARWRDPSGSSRWTPNPKPWYKADFLPACPACGCDDRVFETLRFTRSFALTDLLAVLREKYPRESFRAPFVVNFGAADGAGGIDDPTMGLLSEEATGALLVDGQQDSNLFAKYPNRTNVKILKGRKISPIDVVDLLRSHSVPKNDAILKIDIDSWECSLLQRILDSGYAPSIIMTEINTCFPPPLRFSVAPDGVIPDLGEYEKEIWQQENCFFGCSLASQADILISRGYKLLEVDGWDATFLHASIAHAFNPLPETLEDAWDYGFYQRLATARDCYKCQERCAGVAKVLNDDVYGLSAALQGLQKLTRKDKHADVDTLANELLDKARVIVHGLAPKHKASGSAFPFSLSFEGPGDSLVHLDERCSHRS